MEDNEEIEEPAPIVKRLPRRIHGMLDVNPRRTVHICYRCGEEMDINTPSAKIAFIAKRRKSRFSTYWHLHCLLIRMQEDYFRKQPHRPNRPKQEPNPRLLKPNAVRRNPEAKRLYARMNYLLKISEPLLIEIEEDREKIVRLYKELEGVLKKLNELRDTGGNKYSALTLERKEALERKYWELGGDRMIREKVD